MVFDLIVKLIFPGTVVVLLYILKLHTRACIRAHDKILQAIKEVSTIEISENVFGYSSKRYDWLMQTKSPFGLFWMRPSKAYTPPPWLLQRHYPWDNDPTLKLPVND